jgi:hypothetical protein
VQTDERTRHEPTLDPEARFALQQLCSTAFLAVSSLDETACVRLLRRGLASQDEFGYWSATATGKRMFDLLTRDTRLAAEARRRA